MSLDTSLDPWTWFQKRVRSANGRQRPQGVADNRPSVMHFQFLLVTLEFHLRHRSCLAELSESVVYYRLVILYWCRYH